MREHGPRENETVESGNGITRFHCSEFSDLKQLVAVKEKKDVTISLCLPTLNEEETIGTIITVLKKSLVEKFPLLDEIIVVDSSSSDGTREIARNLGIPVFLHRDILPTYGTFQGKGEALWKSLHATKGDIIVWIDTDIQNIHPRFVYGLVGPLLFYDSISYVKGFYRRPLKVGDSLYPTGGGRVTELTARPLLNIFLPEAAGLIQPLSGEYAGRRSLLEKLPFFTGYSVEIGLIVDIVKNFGTRSIAQTNLIERIHKNKPLRELSKMAYSITRSFLKKMEDYGLININEFPGKSGEFLTFSDLDSPPEREIITEHIRPPIHIIPEYERKFSHEGRREELIPREGRSEVWQGL
ncbi:MAG: glucosyl-3-phosphoglycerate synthase [Deltaproteobacteria bacterium]|nr:MAG: glucosyl-3-phosphoglycerate synthase [Deltaproteobacteria bacterium]